MTEHDAMQKKWVWVPSKTETYKPGYILAEEGKCVRVQAEEEETFAATEVFRMNPTKFDRVDDLSALSHLNEPSVLHNLEMRYEDLRMYTYSGLFLLALNPYRAMGVYGDEEKRRIMAEKDRDGAPHIYAIANEAYRAMMANRANQSILITGESGAGKTENTKRVIEFLSYASREKGGVEGRRGFARDGYSGLDDGLPELPSVNGASGRGGERIDLEDVLATTNPILEAFGNAKTVKNDNSSRFGKFIQVKFRGGSICGAKIEKYLLEKSRVSGTAPNERSFHIFYYLLSGCDDARLLSYELTRNPSDYACLRKTEHRVEGVDDSKEFALLEKAFHELGMGTRAGERMADDYYRTVAAILHLSNIAFDQKDDRAIYADQSVEGYNPLETACRLLNADSARLKAGLLQSVLRAGTELVVQHRTAEQARAVLDGLMKMLYESLFDDLVSAINHILDAPCDNYIGILDIAGFEIFEQNSFEQLCINYTNEKLQQFFNHHMFILEQEIYRAEKIDWDFIDFGMDLQPTINTIESYNPIGILSYLDEECVMPCASDTTLLAKLRTVPNVEAVAFKDAFAIQHYAGRVEYSVKNWLRKNKDTESEGLLNDSRCAHRNGSLIKKGSFKTVAQSHREGLKWLMQTLASTQPHFVRCILPNLLKRPEVFNRSLVLEQLRCNGVLEGIRISRLGYPTRLSFADFNARYDFLIDENSRAGCDSKAGSHAQAEDGRMLPVEKTTELLNSLKLNKSTYKIGKSLVFFRQGVLADLEDIREQKIRHLAAAIQGMLRLKIKAKRESIDAERKKAVLLLQKNARHALGLLRWPWWALFLRVQPLLDVRKSENNLRDLQRQLEDRMAQLKRAEESLALKTNALDRLGMQAAELGEALARRGDEVLDKEALLESLRNENARLAALQKEAEGIQGEKESLLVELAEARKRIADHQAANERICGELAEKSGLLERREEELALMLKQDLGNVLSSKENELAEAKRRLATVEKAKDALGTALAERTQESEALARRNEQLAQDSQRMMERMEQLQSETTVRIEELLEESKASSDLLAKNRSEQSDLQLENDQLSVRVGHLECAVAEKQAALDSLSQELRYERMRTSSLEASLQALRRIKETPAEGKAVVLPVAESAKREESRLAKTVGSLKAKLEHERGMNARLTEERDGLHAENLRLMQAKLDEMFSTESEFKTAKAAMLSEIRSLEAENQRLAKELGDSQIVSDSSDDLGFERVVLLLEDERKKGKALEVRLVGLENDRLKAQNALRLAEVENEELRQRGAAKAEKERVFSEIAALKKDLAASKLSLQTVVATFQQEFFALLSERDAFYSARLAECTEELGRLRMAAARCREVEEQNAGLIAANEQLVKEAASLHSQIENLTVATRTAEVALREHSTHIAKLEDAYNEREGAVALLRQDHAILAESIAQKARECEEAISTARERITERCRNDFDGALRAERQAQAAKTAALLSENATLSGRLAEAEATARQLAIENEEFVRLASALTDARSATAAIPAAPVSERLVSSFVVDKDALRSAAWKQVVAEKCLRCKAALRSTTQKQSGDETVSTSNTTANPTTSNTVMLTNQLSILELKLAQAERTVADSQKIIDGLRSCTLALSKNKIKSQACMSKE